MKIKMLVFTTMVVMLFSVFTNSASAQAYRTDGGVIVLEESLLTPNKKQIIFVATKAIPEPATVQYQISSSEGAVHQFPSMQFIGGLTKGQVIPLWNGEFNLFQTTPWLTFSVTVSTSRENYFVKMNVPINYAEQYKEPMVIEISEVKVSGNKYNVTVKGNFDTYETSTVVINSSIIIPAKAIWYERPSILHFTVNEPASIFSPGKYLLTVCQTGHCDTMVGRHR